MAPSGPYTDVDVSVRCKPMTGRDDASGGIVFRFAEGHYYVVRANALENNVRLYYYDRGRTSWRPRAFSLPRSGSGIPSGWLPCAASRPI